MKRGRHTRARDAEDGYLDIGYYVRLRRVVVVWIETPILTFKSAPTTPNVNCLETRDNL